MLRREFVADVLPEGFVADAPRLISVFGKDLHSSGKSCLVELIKNAADALSRVGSTCLSDERSGLFIKIIPNIADGTLAVVDNGFGMSKDDLIRDLGTIGFSGTKCFAEKLPPNSCLPQTAQFGLGFYSVFGVADKVQVISKRDGNEQFMWESLSKKSFIIRPCSEEQLGRGTKVILHLKKNYTELLFPSVIENIIHTDVEFVAFPIMLISDLEERLVNNVHSVWMRSPEDVRREEYLKLYRYLSASSEEPLSVKHFSCPGEPYMRGVLFISKHYYKNTAEHGVKVCLNHILLADSLGSLLEDIPHDYLYGAIDLFNLRLTLGSKKSFLCEGRDQICERLLKVFLEWFKELSENEEIYNTVCENLKPLLLFLYLKDARFAGFLRYCSSKSGNLKVSLDEYISRMKEDQRTIYFAAGESIEALRDSLVAEKLHQSGIEVIYTANPVDYVFINDRNYYKLYKIRNAGSHYTDVYLTMEDEQEYRKSCMEFASTCCIIKSYLSVQCTFVHVSRRLVNSPCCVFVDGETLFGKPVESNYFNEARKDLEINPNHEIPIRLKELCSNNDVKPALYVPIINMLFETALIDSGFMPPDVTRYTNMVYELIRACLNISKATEMPKETEENGLFDPETSSPVLAAYKGGDVDERA